MKLNLGFSSDGIMPQGYINIDNEIADGLDAKTYKEGDFRLLDWLCEDESVEEIVVSNSINRISFNLLEESIKNWSNKLMQQGVLKIFTSDAYLVAKMFMQDQISLKEYSTTIFGGEDGLVLAKSVLDMITLEQLVQNAGLTITTKRYDGLCLFLEAKKLND